MSIESCLHSYLRESRESETLLINQLSLSLGAEQTVYKFGFGQSPFPVPQHIVSAMAGSAHRKEYMAVQGDPCLREAICEFHAKHEQRQWQSDDVIVGTGSKILIYCVMAAFLQADVLLPGPSWVSYAPQAELAGHDVHWIPTGFDKNWKITAADIEYTCKHLDPHKPKIMVLNYPSNPTGQTYSAEELQTLVSTLRKYNILVIADEIYSFLTFGDAEAHLEDAYPEGVITSSGLSKWCGAGGWRLGYLHVPANLCELKKRIIGVASETYSSAVAPVQIAAVEAYRQFTHAQDFIRIQKQALQHAAHIVTSKLQESGVKVHMSNGGFYLFPNFEPFTAALQRKGIRTSTQLAEVLLREIGVALLPGTAFGMAPESLSLRLAYVDFDGQAVLDGVSDDIVFEKLEAGVTALANWLKKLPRPIPQPETLLSM